MWRAPRIHGELRKLGIKVSERTVSRILAIVKRPPSQTWRTFLKNHVGEIVATDFFTVPTVGLRVLFVFLVFAHERRRVLHFGITEHPTTQWVGQLTGRDVETHHHRLRHGRVSFADIIASSELKEVTRRSPFLGPS